MFRRCDTPDLRANDCFYTHPDVAARCMEFLRDNTDASKFDAAHWIEPSAGDGAFYDLMPESRRTGIDIMPGRSDMLRCDFLHWELPDELAGNAMAGIDGVDDIIVAGNPPFGKNSSMAVRFFNHAAYFARCSCIAMILPRTFRKESVVNRLDGAFHLDAEMQLPDNAFLFDGRPYDVPAIFQVWNRNVIGMARRIVKRPASHPDFEFVKDKHDASFALQRVGVNAGAVKPAPGAKFDAASPSSHYFVRQLASGIDGRVADIMAGIDWNAVKHDTAGCPSLSKPDVVAAYEAAKRA